MGRSTLSSMSPAPDAAQTAPPVAVQDRGGYASTAFRRDGGRLATLLGDTLEVDDAGTGK
jgi:hypothetical protein